MISALEESDTKFSVQDSIIDESDPIFLDLDLIDELDLLMLLWFENWHILYWLLLSLGISCLNFQIYCIFLLSNPLFFISLCTTLGILNPFLIFSFASLLIIGSGFILATLIYTTYTFWTTHHQISDSSLISVLNVWSYEGISPLNIISLAKNENFLFLTDYVSNFNIPTEIKKTVIENSRDRLLILNIFNKLQYHIDRHTLRETFVEDFFYYIERIYNVDSPETQIQAKYLFDCLDLLYSQNIPPYSLIQKFLENPESYQEYQDKLLKFKEELDDQLFYHILSHIEFMPLFEQVTLINKHSLPDTLYQLFFFINQSKIADNINSLTPRPISPFESQNYLQMIKINAFQLIWNKFHSNPNQFWSIWQNISNHPNVDCIFPLIEYFCEHNTTAKSLYECIFGVSQIGKNNEVDIVKLKSIYVDEELRLTFIKSIQLLIDLDALTQELFVVVIFHSKREHLNNLLITYYNENFTSSLDKLKNIYLLIVESDKEINSNQTSSLDEVGEIIKNSDISVPYLGSPTKENRPRFFPPQSQLPTISEDCLGPYWQ